MLLICTYDKAAKQYAPPFMARTVEQAKRNLRMSFEKQFGDSDKALLDDFQFFVVGDFDDETGTIVSKKVEFFLSPSDSCAGSDYGAKS